MTAYKDVDETVFVVVEELVSRDGRTSPGAGDRQAMGEKHGPVDASPVFIENEVLARADNEIEVSVGVPVCGAGGRQPWRGEVALAREAGFMQLGIAPGTQVLVVPQKRGIPQGIAGRQGHRQATRNQIEIAVSVKIGNARSGAPVFDVQGLTVRVQWTPEG